MLFLLQMELPIKVFHALITFILVNNVNALYGNDCANQMANITTVSLTEVGDCNIEEPKFNLAQMYVHLSQITDFKSTQVFQCSINISRMVTHCGMHSHASRVQDATKLNYYYTKLLIFEDAQESLFVKKDTIATANPDIFAYVNSKFLYVEKYFRGQLDSLYYDILKSKCEERKVITNALSIATINTAEFGYRIMGERGYLVVVTGEVIHLLKCLQVEVIPRPTKECYDQLPVLR